MLLNNGQMLIRLITSHLYYNISTGSFCTTYISIFHHSAAVFPSSLPSSLKCIKLRRKLRFSEVPHPNLWRCFLAVLN